MLNREYPPPPEPRLIRGSRAIREIPCRHSTSFQPDGLRKFDPKENGTKKIHVSDDAHSSTVDGRFVLGGL